MNPELTAISDVEAWNDAFARENDIDDYYAQSGGLIRFIENQRLSAIRSLLAPQPGDRVLEVGCGGGHVLRMFPECDLTGVDVSGEMLAKASVNLRGYRVRLLKGELQDLDLPVGGFDRIICTEVLEHVVDPARVLDGMSTLVKPGGRLAITLPNDRLVNSLKAIVRGCGLNHVPPFRRISWGGDHYHLHQWSVGAMREMLSRHFTIARECFAPSRLMPIRCCFQCLPRT